MRFHLQILWLVILLVGVGVLAQDDSVLPITEDTNYVVRPADTLDTIGALFDVSPSCLADENNITKSRELYVGTTILIPVSCPLYGNDARDLALANVLIPREVVTFEDDCDGYRVQRNDNIDTIGFDLNISSVSIAVENNLQPPYILQINQCLVIPEDAPPWGEYPPLTLANPEFEAGGGSVPPGVQVVLQPLDTLDVIAQEYNVSVVSIILTNKIADARQLQPGTVIIIPDDAPAYGLYPAVTEPVLGQIYVVEPGETLDDIAQSFDIALRALEVANDIEAGRNAPIGTAILIPDNVPTYGNDDDFDESMLGQGGGATTRVVQPRDTLDGISALFDVNTQCLMEANNIRNPRHVQPGTVLIIDETCGPYVGEGIPALSDSVSPANSGSGGGATDETSATTTAESTDATTDETTDESTSEEAVPITERGDEGEEESTEETGE